MARAFAEGLTDHEQLATMLERHHRFPGSPRLRSLLEERTNPDLTRSEAEERFLALVMRAQLPRPALNVRVQGFEVDFLWRAQRLVVEVDGKAFHSSSSAFEADRRRDATLSAAGLRVIRVTWRQLVREPEAVLVRLSQALVRGDH